jgi:hypothetical protein
MDPTTTSSVGAADGTASFASAASRFHHQVASTPFAGDTPTAEVTATTDELLTSHPNEAVKRTAWSGDVKVASLEDVQGTWRQAGPLFTLTFTQPTHNFTQLHGRNAEGQQITVRS